MIQIDKLTGFLIINKPRGITSHDVVDYVRKITLVKKVGHGGTLDPQATGVLVVGVGRNATKKLSSILKNIPKTYIAEIKFGWTSPTYDNEGNLEKVTMKKLPKKDLLSILNEFRGKIKQTPPPYSAVKIKGEKAYELARKGVHVKLKQRIVEISGIKLLKYSWPYMKIEVKCSSGTYIRSLANDIGKLAKGGAILYNLQRTAVGRYKIEDAVNLGRINKQNWVKLLS